MPELNQICPGICRFLKGAIKDQTTSAIIIPSSFPKTLESHPPREPWWMVRSYKVGPPKDSHCWRKEQQRWILWFRYYVCNYKYLACICIYTCVNTIYIYIKKKNILYIYNVYIYYYYYYCYYYCCYYIISYYILYVEINYIYMYM